MCDIYICFPASSIERERAVWLRLRINESACLQIWVDAVFGNQG